MKIALLGTGFGQAHAAVYAKRSDIDQVVVFGRSPRKLAKINDQFGFATTTDLDAVITDPSVDLVDICLPTKVHAEVAVRAMQAGKDVLVELPLATTLEDAHDSIRERLRTLPLGQLLQTCAGLRGSARHSAEESATVAAMRSTARRALACEHEAAELEAQLDRLVRRLAPDLLEQLGIGPVVAGQVITSWSHHGRVRSEAAFAKLGGAAPIEASSGMVIRHRLNRSGDRQLNRALHTIVLVRMRQDCATKAYVQRRLAQGKTIRDIKRCLKRYVARQLFRQLEALPSPA
jgi:hypothetical protein